MGHRIIWVQVILVRMRTYVPVKVLSDDSVRLLSELDIFQIPHLSQWGLHSGVILRHYWTSKLGKEMENLLALRSAYLNKGTATGSNLRICTKTCSSRQRQRQRRRPLWQWPKQKRKQESVLSLYRLRLVDLQETKLLSLNIQTFTFQMGRSWSLSNRLPFESTNMCSHDIQTSLMECGMYLSHLCLIHTMVVQPWSSQIPRLTSSMLWGLCMMCCE